MFGEKTVNTRTNELITQLLVINNK